MTKPDDVSQAAWNSATSRVSAIFGVGDYSHTLSHELARAIDAAVADERETCAAMAEKAMIGSLCPYGNDKPGDPTWGHTDEDICPVCRVNGHDALFKCHDSISGRLAAAIRARPLQADKGLEP